jgi:hypothetical protein
MLLITAQRQPCCSSHHREREDGIAAQDGPAAATIHLQLLLLPLLGFGFHAATCVYACKHYIKKLKERRDIVEV